MKLSAEDRYIAWLSSIEGVGLAKFDELMAAYGSPKDVFEEAPRSPLKLCDIHGIGRQMCQNVINACTDEYMDAFLRSVEEGDMQVITYKNPLYPQEFKNYSDMPVTLYCRGDVSLLNHEKNLAIVGTRAPTHYGREVSRNLSFRLASVGVCIVSGMARGIDGAAHRGALDAEGKTIAVLGSGVDVPYPRENTEIYERIGKTGLIVSEYPPQTPPRGSYFPRRNRIISALAKGVLVVEAGERSGSSITVTHAIEQGKDVFAVPGNITSPNSVASNRLIREGCNVVVDADDILLYYSWTGAGNRKKTEHRHFAPLEKMVLNLLDDGEKTFDELFEALDTDMATLLAAVSHLEEENVISALPGRMYGKNI